VDISVDGGGDNIETGPREVRIECVMDAIMKFGISGCGTSLDQFSIRSQ
jgi:hypothetical protein